MTDEHDKNTDADAQLPGKLKDSDAQLPGTIKDSERKIWFAAVSKTGLTLTMNMGALSYATSQPLRRLSYH